MSTEMLIIELAEQSVPIFGTSPMIDERGVEVDADELIIYSRDSYILFYKSCRLKHLWEKISFEFLWNNIFFCVLSFSRFPIF